MLSNLTTKPTRILSVQSKLKQKRILSKIVHCGVLNTTTKFGKKKKKKLRYALNVKTESEAAHAAADL